MDALDRAHVAGQYALEPPTEITGALAATEGADVGAFSGALAITGALAATEGADVGAFVGGLLISGSLAAVDGADGAAFTSSFAVSGALAATEGADSAAFREDRQGVGYSTQYAPILLLEFEAHDGDSIITLRYSTHPIQTTRPDDTPASTQFYGRLARESGALKRSLFEGGGTVGQPGLSSGYFELINSDGALNALTTYGVGGREFRLYELSSIDAYVNTRTLIFKGTLRGIDSTNLRKSLRLRIRDKLEGLRVPLLSDRYLGNTTAGSNTAEGSDDVKGKLKPMVFGYTFQTPAIPVNASDLIYQATAGPCSFIRAYDGGSVLTIVTGTSDFANIASLRAATIPAGRYATCLALGLFRLGAEPGSVVTVECSSVPLSPETGRGVGPIAKQILTEAGYSSSDFDEASFDALTSADGHFRTGIYVDSDETVLSVVCKVLNAMGATLVATPLGVLKAVLFGEFVDVLFPAPDPMPPDAPVDTFTLSDIGGEDAVFAMQGSPVDEGDNVPAWAINIRHMRLWRPLSETEVNGSITNPSSRNRLGREWFESARGNAGVKIVHPLAQMLNFDCLFNLNTGALIEAARRLELYGRIRDYPTISVSRERAGDLDLGDIVALDIEGSKYEGGQNFYIIQREDVYGSRRVIFKLWG